MKIILTLMLAFIVSAGIAQKQKAKKHKPESILTDWGAPAGYQSAVFKIYSWPDTPKQHVYYDTMKTVQQRIDYEPDTIPVYFKELKIVVADKFLNGDSLASTYIEVWHKGFVIWQTYKKSGGVISWSGNSTTGTFSTVDYYKDEYEGSPILHDVFLYDDRRTRVKNTVIFSIKR